MCWCRSCQTRSASGLHVAPEVARNAVLAGHLVPLARAVLVNGAAGIVAIAEDGVRAVMGLTVTQGKIAAIDVLIDPDLLARLDVTFREG